MDKYQQILKQYWGYDDFRGIQREIIESIGEGKDTLGLMPTGGGKSITFQVPALSKAGTCVVITPLIALMKDQVQHLREKGIKAAAIYSGMKRQEIVRILDNCILGGTKLLYVSPERLSSELFRRKLLHMNVSFITVDEAHCISQWGYDFRPAYLDIADIRKIKPQAPVLALTATATKQVIADIQQKLAFKAENVFRMSFERKNLCYVVRKTEDKHAQLVHILEHVTGSAIVYVRSRRRCKEIAELLEKNGISSTYYHAGLEHSDRDLRQKQWQTDEKRVIVATNAFGMGIDKPDVRTVIHFDSPDSIEAYFQEAGRAGRDGKKAYAVLLWGKNDIGILNHRVDDNFPSKEYINDVYKHLAYYFEVGVGSGSGHTFTFEIQKFCVTYRLFPVPVNSALHLLENAGYIHYEVDPDMAARVMILLDRDHLYRLDGLTDKENAVIAALLRGYGGLFTDYQYIDEQLIAAKTQMSHPECYQVLKSLSQRRIISFIPQRRIPYITYLRDREDEVYLPVSVYEDRKEQFIKRISAFIKYATNDTVCRSKQLLQYFGEDDAHACGHCDVCIAQRQQDMAFDDAAMKKVTYFLGDKREHTLGDILSMGLPKDDITHVINSLSKEGKIKIEGDNITLL